MARSRKRKKKKAGRKAPPPLRFDQGKCAPISLCMIVKNEEQFLPGCLESVQGLVAEMIVVDTGSSDRTMDIARQYGARVFEYTWQGDFAAARNEALKRATQPWILYLDADERLHPQHHPIVRQAVQSAQADAFYIRVHSEVRGILGNVPHVQSYPRLFRRLPGVRFVGKVHEQITPALQAAGARFALLDAEIEHLGYAQSDEVLEEKIHRNLHYLEQQLTEEPENAYARFQLGQTYILANRVEEGEAQLRQAIDSGRLSAPLTGTALLILANEAFKRGEHQKALQLCEQSLRVAPRQRLGWFLISECQAALQNWQLAKEALLNMEAHRNLPASDLSMDKNFSERIVEQRLGLYAWKLGEHREAAQHLARYFSFPGSLRCNFLRKWLYSLGQESALLEQYRPVLEQCMNRLADFNEPREAVSALFTFFQERNDGAAQITLLERATEQFPREAEYHFYLGTLYLNQNQLRQAERALQTALELAPDVFETQYNLSVLFIKKGELEKAIEQFEEMRMHFPQHRLSIERKLAALYIKLGKVDRALPLINLASQNAS